jgi:predicted regulator of Ras-like GTPase activity (Roadblock/LC7/MglB family)
MDVAPALEQLLQDSSQVERAVVLGSDGKILGSTLPDQVAAETFAQHARELIAVAAELRSSDGDVTRVEVELAEGAVFVIHEGETTIAATTGPRPTPGLVTYDLRTCLNALADAKPKRRRATNKPKDEGKE